MTDLIELGSTTAPDDPELDATRRAKLADYLEHLYSENTKKAYRCDWNHWESWCQTQQISPIPATPQNVVAYLLDHGGELKPSTLSRRLITIGKAHKHVGLDSPVEHEHVRQTFSGLVRVEGEEVKRAAPLLADDVRAFIDAIPDDAGLIGLRDRAMLLIGWFGAFRQSELAGLRFDDVKIRGARMTIKLGRSKTDQTGRGKLKWFNRNEEEAYCPIHAVEQWLDGSRVSSGALFRPIGRWGNLGRGAMRPQSVTDMLRRMADAALYEPEDFSGHSLRRGFCVQAALNGASLDEIMAQTHHRDVKTVMRYIEEANAQGRNAIHRVSL